MRSASAPRSSALPAPSCAGSRLLRGAASVIARAAAGRGAGAPLGPGARPRAARHLARRARRRWPARPVLQPCALQAIDGRGRSLSSALALGRRGRRRDRRRAPALVVAAHGSWEPLPSERAVRREQRAPSDLFAFKANFRRSAIEPDLLPVLSFAGGYGGMVVADDGIATLAGCIREDRLGRDREATSRRARRRRVRGDAARECARRRRGAGRRGARRRLARQRADPPGRAPRARATASFASATPPAKRIRSSARASAWRCSRRSCSRPCSVPDRPRLVEPDSAADAQATLLREYEARWRRRFFSGRTSPRFAHLAMLNAAASAAGVATSPDSLTHENAAGRWMVVHGALLS